MLPIHKGIGYRKRNESSRIYATIVQIFAEQCISNLTEERIENN